MFSKYHYQIHWGLSLIANYLSRYSTEALHKRRLAPLGTLRSAILCPPGVTPRNLSPTYVVRLIEGRGYPAVLKADAHASLSAPTTSPIEPLAPSPRLHFVHDHSARNFLHKDRLLIKHALVTTLRYVADPFFGVIQSFTHKCL